MPLLEATAPTGLEPTAEEEIKEKLQPAKSWWTRGRVFFDVALERATQAQKLRSIDNLFVVIFQRDKLNLENRDPQECIQDLRNLLPECDWAEGLKTWETLYGEKLHGGIDKHLQSLKTFSEKVKARQGNEPIDPAPILEGPKFRVTGHRGGDKHKFGSPECAAEFGGEVQKCFGWPVSMKQFDVEVVLNVQENKVTISIALTRESLYKRNIAFFGPTCLRASICYSMIRMARPASGDVICDPLCGGGSIPIEAKLQWPDCSVVAGDMHPLAVERIRDNLNALETKTGSKLAIHTFAWDARELPLLSESVDCIVSDLPFGKRSGYKWDNRRLYPDMLLEWSRVAKRRTGRAVLLTYDKNTLIKAVQRHTRLWKATRMIGANIGGLHAVVFVLKRTDMVDTPAEIAAPLVPVNAPDVSTAAPIAPISPTGAEEEAV